MQETKITLTPLFSGSSGNAILVRAGRSSVLVDAGVSARAVCGALECAGLDARQLSAVVITHEHADHIKGVPMLAKKIGFDPAVMASPFITTIVDALALLVYFSFATQILRM